MNASPDVCAPELHEQDFERFLVHDKLEIISILRALQAERETVSMHWGSDRFALTMLMAVNPEFEEMVFDCTNDPGVNRRLTQCERITMVAVTGGVKIQFTARFPDATVFEGHPALRMRLPDLVLRLQRREYFRIPASIACQVAVEGEGRVRVLELRVADISLGGLALVADKNFLDLECGEVLPNCRISLGSLGTLAVSLAVGNISETRTRSGGRLQRIGCSFEQLPRNMETLVSRYIAQVERERRARV